MTVECRGADFNTFMQDKTIWRDGCWFDDVYVEVDGTQNELELSFAGDDVLPAEATVIVQGGEYYVGSEVNSTFYSFEETLRNWLKNRSVTVVVLEIENDKLDACREAIQKIPGVAIVS